jgi:hypothetical protein
METAKLAKESERKPIRHSSHWPRIELSGIRPSPHGRSGRRREASRSWRNCSAAIAGAMIWLPVSSSGGIGDAASVSANAMDRRPGLGRRRVKK